MGVCRLSSETGSLLTRSEFLAGANQGAPLANRHAPSPGRLPDYSNVVVLGVWFNAVNFRVKLAPLSRQFTPLYIDNLRPFLPGVSFWLARIKERLSQIDKSIKAKTPASQETLNPNLISQKVFLKSFCKSQFPLKFVNVVIVKDKLTDLWGR